MCIRIHQVLLENPELTLRSHAVSTRVRSLEGRRLSITEEKVDESNVGEAAEELSLVAESCKYLTNSFEVL